MVEFVAVDHSAADRGNRFFLVGVALEVDNGSDFDEHYFRNVRQFCDRYDIDLTFDIIKTRDVLNRVASYDIRDASETLLKVLVQNPALRRIHVCIGWFGEEIQLPWKDESMRGINFASDYLHQYFPIVTFWRYHESHQKNMAISQVKHG